MSDVRDFDEEYAYASKPGLTFRLGGHEFHTKPVLSPKGFYMVAADDNPDVHPAVTTIRWALIPEEREVFQEMVDDPDAIISMFQLDKIAGWIIEETSGRPTESPVSSGNGDGQTPTTSTESSPSLVTTGGE